MRLPTPPPGYDVLMERERNRILEMADSGNVKRESLYQLLRDFQNKGWLPWFNVKMHGAKGDGTTDDTSAVIACVAAACAAGDGGVVIFPPGSYCITETITPTKALRLYGGVAGPDNAGSHRAATIMWTGGADEVIHLTGVACTNSLIEGLHIDNEGTATIGIRIDSSASHVVVRDVGIVQPTVAFSDAGIVIGRTGSVSTTKLEDVILREAGPVNLRIENTDTLFHAYHCAFMDPASGGTVSVQIGTASLRADFTHFHGCSFESTTSGAIAIKIVNDKFVTVDGGSYFELYGNDARAVEVPSDSVTAVLVVVRDSRLGIISGAPWCFESNFGSAIWLLDGNEVDGSGATGFLKNTALRHASINKNVYKGSFVTGWLATEYRVRRDGNTQTGSTLVRDDGYTVERIATVTTAVGNVGTGEDDLMSTSVAANRLYENGQVLRVTAWGSTAANGNNKTAKLYVGGTAVLSTGALAANGKDWVLRGTVIRNGATTGLVIADGQANGGVVQADHQGLTVASTGWDAAQVVKVTGEATDNDDIVCRGLLVEASN